MKALDADNDGMLSFGEFRKMWSKFGMELHDVEELFMNFDTNPDGEISKDELAFSELQRRN